PRSAGLVAGIAWRLAFYRLGRRFVQEGRAELRAAVIRTQSRDDAALCGDSRGWRRGRYVWTAGGDAPSASFYRLLGPAARGLHPPARGWHAGEDDNEIYQYVRDLFRLSRLGAATGGEKECVAQ